MGTDGVYARTSLYEDMVERLAALITRHREPDTEVMRFPPVMNRGQLEKSGYLKSFPNLLGCVCGLHGTNARSTPPSAALMPVATGPPRSRPRTWCFPRPPATRSIRSPRAAARCPRAAFASTSRPTCFRREPSRHLDRLQSFRMREYVCIGSPDDVSDFRERWMVRAQSIARDLGLAFKVDYASDPFFGRVGQMKAVSQIQQSLKFELLIPLRPRSNRRPA
jgi:Seryl-tRNA synthetase